MPTYEYECPEGHAFEKFQKMTDKPRAKCPVCGKPATRKISGGAGSRLQGQRLLHHRLRQGRQGAAQGRNPRSRPPSPSRTAPRQGRASPTPSQTAKPAPEGASQAGEEGRLRVSDALRAELARVASRLGADGVEFVLERPRDAGPWRPRHQPGHGARQARARQSPQDRRAGARRAAPLARPGRTHRDRRPRLHQLLAGRRISSPPSTARILEQGAGYGRSTVGSRPQGQRRVRLRQSDRSAPRRATAAGPRSATRSPRCSSGPGTRSPASSTSTTPGSRSTAWPQSLWARVRELAGHPAAIPEGGYHGEYLRENAREVLAREGRRLRRAARRRGRSAGAARLRLVIQRAGAGPRSRGLRRPLRRHVVGAGHLRLGPRRARARAARAQRGLTFEAEGALWLRTTDFGDDKDRVLRKGDGSFTYLVPDIAYHIDKHERGFDRVDRRVGRRSPRLHPAHARGARGARLSAGVLRRRAGAAGQGGAGRGRGEDVEAVGRVRHPARSLRGGRRGRGALLLPHAQGRDARSTSTSTSPSGRPTRTRSSTSRWRTRA